MTTLESPLGEDEDYPCKRRVSVAPERTPGLTILVEDEEPDLLNQYRKCLSQIGFSVCTAADGREAVTRFIEFRPEVVVLDCGMTGGDGLEAAGEILAMKPSSKVVMLTADSFLLGEAERIGVEVFLKKPVPLKLFVDTVLTLCEIRPTSSIVSR